MSNTSASTDPVLVRREQVRRLVRLGKSIGYGLFLVAIIVFIVARLDDPRPIYTTLLAWTMGVGSLLLAPAIVFGYAIGAAEREERQRAAAKAAKKAPHA
jgi:cytochrome c-type biogenesis protein CcmH/NrfF